MGSELHDHEKQAMLAPACARGKPAGRPRIKGASRPEILVK